MADPHGKGGLSKKKFQELATNLKSDLVSYKKGYDKLLEAVKAIQETKGEDNTVGLWKGKNANRWIFKAYESLDKNASLYNVLEELAVEIAYEAKIDK